MSVTLDDRQLRSLIRKLDRIGGATLNRRAMTKAVLHFQSVIAEYPPHTAANMPPGINGYSWYVRGSGTHTITGKVYKTSENLGPGWTTSVSPDGQRGVISNRASYALPVQGKEKQTDYHRARGWKNDEDTLDDERRKIIGFFQAEYDEALRRP